MALKMISDLTEVDDSQMQNAALVEGAIPPVSGSIFTPVKVTLAKLAKWIINSYTGLSLGGSNQSVKSAIDSLNGSLANYIPTNAAGTALASGADLDNYESGYYNCPSNTVAASLSNSPTSVAFVMIVLLRASGRPIQIVIDNNAALYVRAKQSGSAWSSWSTK